MRQFDFVDSAPIRLEIGVLLPDYVALRACQADDCDIQDKENVITANVCHKAEGFNVH